MRKTLITILGPTAVGKTKIGITLAKKTGTEIISADSRQIFRELKIGTASPDIEQLKTVPHHFIGTQSIHNYYNASMFEVDVLKLLKEKFTIYDSVLMVGGSGMYIDAVCSGIDDLPVVDPEIRSRLQDQYHREGIESLRLQLKILDPEYYSKVDLKNPNRILKGLEISIMTGKSYSSFLTQKKKIRDFSTLKIGLNIGREELYDRINLRVDQMIKKGLLEEARGLYPYRELNALKTVGYRELFPCFDGKISLDKAIDLIKRNTRRFAKRQLTWFQRDKDIHWFQPSEIEKIFELSQLFQVS